MTSQEVRYVFELLIHLFICQCYYFSVDAIHARSVASLILSKIIIFSTVSSMRTITFITAHFYRHNLIIMKS